MAFEALAPVFQLHLLQAVEELIQSPLICGLCVCLSVCQQFGKSGSPPTVLKLSLRNAGNSQNSSIRKFCWERNFEFWTPQNFRGLKLQNFGLTINGSLPTVLKQSLRNLGNSQSLEIGKFCWKQNFDFRPQKNLMGRFQNFGLASIAPSFSYNNGISALNKGYKWIV